MTVNKGLPYPLGTQRENNGLNFAHVCKSPDCGVVLFDRESQKEIRRIPFPAQYALGDIRCMHVKGIDADRIAYCFYEGDRLESDAYGRAFLGGKEFGKADSHRSLKLALPMAGRYDWEGDENPCIPYEESICYCAHVRGFTRHASSKVRGRGTFLGLTEKIPYLKELGITTLELQPIYEFDELEPVSELDAPYLDAKQKEYRTNYWGYAKGRYYSPKNAYAASDDAVKECRDMIKALHKNGMEVILQFYFTADILEQEIADILRFWVFAYHVDGFHLKGENIEPGMLSADPALSRTKLWYYAFPGKKYGKSPASQAAGCRRLAEYRDDFRNDMRRFLKGDEGMLPSVMYHLRHNPAECGQVNYLTNYDGFTMMDLVSFDRKHNEGNGEDNRDGTDFNASWNCGTEGRSRKKSIAALRTKQIKNALMLLLLAQGTPLFFMGDEFGNSQNGNNNPYCQDNEVTWLNWKNRESHGEIYEFTAKLIALRKAHPVLRQRQEVRTMDYGACGYPDASYHGEAPWKPDTAGYSRQLGIMYCGMYAYKDKRTPDDFFYVAYNMHWEPHSFAMPKLPKGMHWEICLTSDESVQEEDGKEQSMLIVPARCTCLFVSVRDD